jgi:hypothetical protein
MAHFCEGMQGASRACSWFGADQRRGAITTRIAAVEDNGESAAVQDHGKLTAVQHDGKSAAVQDHGKLAAVQHDDSSPRI